MASKPLLRRRKYLLGLLLLLATTSSLLYTGLTPSASAWKRGALKTQIIKDSQDRDPKVVIISTGYKQTNLVSDVAGLGILQDPLLVNPWGITATAMSPFWVANNGTSTSTLYQGDVAGSPFVKNAGLPFVTIPGGLPTGIVANTTNDFVVTSGAASGPARFIFSSENGNISGWNPTVPAAGSTAAQIAGSHPSHVYKGLAIGNNGSANFLYAADFANKKIDVFNATFALTTLAGNFIDPTIPSTFAPFNITNLGGRLFVSYAKVGADGDPEPGPGNGFVSVFNTNGNFLGRLVSNGPLNSPWGMVIAPASFGLFGGSLLVGNFTDAGTINAFNPTTGAFLGTLQDENGQPIHIDQLWALLFGNGTNGGDPNTLYFTAGIGQEEHGLLGSLKPTAAPDSSLVALSDTDYTIDEGAGSISITVVRQGNVASTATVNFATFDVSQPGRASQKSDYEIAAGTLNFSPGETSKTFPILIVDDLYVEGAEKLGIVLSNPTGAGLGNPNHAEVTIVDNDSVIPTTNPLEDAQYFVRQHYLDLLNREPDLGGLAFWTAQITRCGTDATCITRRRNEVSASFFLSQEFLQSAFYAYRIRKASLGVVPLYGQFVVDRNIIGQGNVPDRIAFSEGFVVRPDFLSKYPTSQSGNDFVDAVIANVLASSGVDLASKRDELIAEYGAATTQQESRARVLRKVVEYPQYVSAESNRAFVLSEYFGYLRRDPDVAGFAFWLNVINNQVPPNFPSLVCAFITSAEYQERFSSVTPRTNADCGP